MLKVKTNAKNLSVRYAKRITALNSAIASGLRALAIKVDAEQVENLSGDGDRGSYPVPVRSGTLRRGTFFNVVNRQFAIVGNKTIYAASIHDGRPFLDNAVDNVKPVEIIGDHLKKEVWAIL